MSEISGGTVTLERRGHVWLMGLNRVAKRNAFDPAMFHELARAYGAYEADPDLRCAVVFAHGPHFTGGIDLAQFAPLFESGDPFASGAGEIDPFGLRSHLSKPLVMAVQGITFTIGIEMLLAADIRIAASNVRFAQLEIARGLYPLGGATFRLVREAGWGNAMRYLLTGDEFGAAEALRLGLIQEVTEAGQELARAISIAERIAAQSPLGVQATLRSARGAIADGECAAARLQQDMPSILASEDFREGIVSFRERRPAKFSGK
ncbi:MAG TPA: crotonase/enoyl-CoA hydratase family protein [Bryobacteraceae bacterium]|jgi:enoyl-CoA hydratase/carnithine racemase|nr:crotonase/enoyl-CoA hydratase family protein [Bryobacteraceae bacterium]